MSGGSISYPISEGTPVGGAGPERPHAEAWLDRHGPHRTAGDTHGEIVRAWTFAAAFVAVWGAVFFGPAALWLTGTCVAVSVAADWACRALWRCGGGDGRRRAVLNGLLLALTIPATAPIHVAVAAAIFSVVLGQAIFGGLGHYLWNPVLVGRVIVQFFFGAALGGSGPGVEGTVLAPDGVFLGDLSHSQTVRPYEYADWASVALAPGKVAMRGERTDSALRQFAFGRIRPEEDLVFAPLLRDALPPWRDALIGAVPGAMGETPALALIIAGLYLVYRGYLRWQLPIAMLAAAGLAASVFPVESAGHYSWWPAIRVEQGEAVGLAYVLHQLTAGGLLLAAILIAGDSTTAPLRGRGQAVFGAGAGVITIFLRLYSPVPCEAYWAVLIMNAVVPVIDRQLRRPVLGIPE